MERVEHLELKLSQLFPDDDRRLIAAAERGRYGSGDHEHARERLAQADLAQDLTWLGQVPR